MRIALLALLALVMSCANSSRFPAIGQTKLGMHVNAAALVGSASDVIVVGRGRILAVSIGSNPTARTLLEDHHLTFSAVACEQTRCVAAWEGRGQTGTLAFEHGQKGRRQHVISSVQSRAVAVAFIGRSSLIATGHEDGAIVVTDGDMDRELARFDVEVFALRGHEDSLLVGDALGGFYRVSKEGLIQPLRRQDEGDEHQPVFSISALVNNEVVAVGGSRAEWFTRRASWSARGNDIFTVVDLDAAGALVGTLAGEIWIRRTPGVAELLAHRLSSEVRFVAWTGPENFAALSADGNFVWVKIPH